jgi:hypothetical protein
LKIYNKAISNDNILKNDEKLYLLSAYLIFYAEFVLRTYKAKLSNEDKSIEKNTKKNIKEKIIELVSKNLSFKKDSYSLYLLLIRFYSSYKNNIGNNEDFFNDFIDRLSKFRTKKT